MDLPSHISAPLLAPPPPPFPPTPSSSSSVPNTGSFPSDFDASHVAAASFLLDALHGRENTVYHTDRLSLRCKFMYHDSRYRNFVSVVSLCHVALGFFEGKEGGWFGAEWYLECLFCLVYIFDSLLLLKFTGIRRWLKQDSWTMVLAVFMLLDVVFLASSVEALRYPALRCLRPAFFAARRRHLKASFSSMFLAIAASLPLMFYLLLYCLLYALLGWLAFGSQGSGDDDGTAYDVRHVNATFCSTVNHGDGVKITGECRATTGDCTDYFRTYASSLYQVWIMLIKVNLPDLMIPYYTTHSWSSLYFVFFTVSTQFFFLRLILAACFTNYKGDSRARYRRRLAFKTVALLKAFALLSVKQHQEEVVAPGAPPSSPMAMGTPPRGGWGQDDVWSSSGSSGPPSVGKAATRDIVKQPRGRKGIEALHQVLGSPARAAEHGNMISKGSVGTQDLPAVIKLSDWRRTMAIVRPDLKSDPWIYDLIFLLASNDFKAYKDSAAAAGADEATPSSSSPVLTFSEFSEACHSINLDVVRRVERRAADTPFTDPPSFLRAAASTLTKKDSFFLPTLSGIVALCAVATIVASAGKFDSEPLAAATVLFGRYIIVLLLAVSLYAKATAQGWKDYFSKTGNKLDASIVLLLIVAHILEATSELFSADELDAFISAIYLVALARFSVFFKTNPTFSPTFNGMKLVLPILLRIMIVFLTFHYAFVMIGTSLFESSLLNEAALINTPYHQVHYDSVNFGSFWSATLLLHQCLLGPNFPVFVEAVAAGYGSWPVPITFFVLYYVLLVVFVQNVVVAFIIEAYVSQRDKQRLRLSSPPAAGIPPSKQPLGGGRPSRSVSGGSQPDPSQALWRRRMRAALTAVLSCRHDVFGATGRDSEREKADETLIFDFSRKPPHHELYDSVFHGDELAPAKIRIRIGLGEGSREDSFTVVSHETDADDTGSGGVTAGASGVGGGVGVVVGRDPSESGSVRSRSVDGKDWLLSRTPMELGSQRADEEDTDGGSSEGRERREDYVHLQAMQARIDELEEVERRLKTELHEVLQRGGGAGG